MKKQFLLLFAMMMAMCSYGQVWKRATLERAPFKAPLMTNRAPITPGEGQIWWGYMSESDLSKTTTVGTGEANVPFVVGIFVPENHEIIGSSTIKAIRVYVDGGLGTTMKDVKVWISKSLPATLDEADYVQSVSSLADGANDIELNTPFAVDNQSFYIGYAVTSSNKYPIMCCGIEDAPNTFLICSPGKMAWEDLNGYGFGKLAFQILVEGATLIDYNASPSDFGSVYGKIGENTSAEVKIANNGAQSITSIDYTITTDGVAGPEQHADLATPIGFLSKGTAVITIPSETTQSIKDKTLTITKVNDNPNEAANKTAQFTLYSLPKIIDRNVVVEEFTGTGCGWCPRGLVGMEKLRNNFGDRFIGIGIHRYNTSDPMYIANYAPISFSGAPSARIDRGQEIDPYYGIFDDICNDFSNEMAIPSLGAIEVSGTFDEEQDIVNATAVIEPLFDDTYDVEFSLVADGLTGTTNAWKQSNYYAQYSASQLPDDLSIFGNGGKYGQSSVAGWIFNDVAIASSFKSNTNQVTAQTVSGGQKANYAYTLPLPTDATLKDALKMDQIYVVAIMTNSKGMVVNAAKVKVTDYDPSSVSGIRNATTTEAARYTLDGRQVTAPQHGLNIIRLSDGTVKKIMVK